MSEARFNLTQLRAAIQTADPDAELRVRQSDPSVVTTAERGFGGRVVQFFSGPDLDSNAAIARSLLVGLKEEFGTETALRAFTEVRGGQRVGDILADDARKPVTARQIRDIESFAKVFQAEQRRDIALGGALHYAPGTSAFEKVACQAQVRPGQTGVDTTALSQDRKDFYSRMLQHQIGVAARPDRPDQPPLSGEAHRKIAAKTLGYVARLDDQDFAAARNRQRNLQDAGKNVIASLAAGKNITTGQFSAAAARFAHAVNACANDYGLAGPNEEAGPKDLDRARAVALTNAMQSLTPSEAKRLFGAALASDGIGRQALFGAAANFEWASNKEYATGSKVPNGFSGAAAAQWTAVRTTLLALAERAGVTDAAAQLDRIDDAGEAFGSSVFKRGGLGKAQLPSAQKEDAGLSGLTAAKSAMRGAAIGHQVALQLGTQGHVARERDHDARYDRWVAASAQNLSAAQAATLDDARLRRLIDAAGAGPADKLTGFALVEARAHAINAFTGAQGEVFESGAGIARLTPTQLDAALTSAIATKTKEIQVLAGRLAVPDRLAAARSNPRLGSALQSIEEMSGRRGLARMTASSGEGAAFELREQRRLSEELRGMPNRQLLGYYRDILSADMLELRLDLANRQETSPAARQALEDLNTWEAMVQTELAARALVRTDAGDPTPGLAPITGRQVSTLGDVELRAQKREIDRQSDAYLSGDASAARTAQLQSVAAAQRVGVPLDVIGKAIHEADLTINVPEALFQPGGAFRDPVGNAKSGALALQNIFERPAGYKTPGYVERRTMVEHAQLPTLAKQDAGGLNPADHPISAAVNIGRNVGGAASGTGYGTVVLVLRDEVKTRATYTARDSFDVMSSSIDRDKAAAMKADIAGLVGDPSGTSMPEAARDALLSHLPAIFERLDAAAGANRHFGIGQPQKLEDFVYENLLGGLKNLEEQATEKLYNLAVKHFTDAETTRDNVSTLDRLPDIVGAMASDARSPVLQGAVSAASDPMRVNTVAGGYVEAQIFGGVDLRRDVKEIRISAEDFTNAKRASLEQFAASLGVTLRATTQDERLRVTRLATDETVCASVADVMPEALAARMATSMQGFRQSGRLEKVLDTYKAHEQDFDPTGIHGRRHIGRALIYSDVLANIIRERTGATVNSDVLYTTVGLHDSGREGNGRDLWEKESGANAAAHYADEFGVQMNREYDFKTLVQTTIDHGSPSHMSIEGAILKSADSLDIIRVFGRDNFDPSLCWFMNKDAKVAENAYLIADQMLRDTLVDEVARFIVKTEPQAPSEDAYDAKRAEFLDAANSKAVTQEQLEALNAQMVALKTQVNTEHKEMNEKLGSLEVFDNLVAKLREDPKEFPFLNKYYSPDSPIAALEGGTQDASGTDVKASTTPTTGRPPGTNPVTSDATTVETRVQTSLDIDTLPGATSGPTTPDPVRADAQTGAQTVASVLSPAARGHMEDVHADRARLLNDAEPPGQAALRGILERNTDRLSALDSDLVRGQALDAARAEVRDLIERTQARFSDLTAIGRLTPKTLLDRLGPASAQRPFAGQAYVEPQRDAACSVHALNAFMGGPAITRDEMNTWIRDTRSGLTRDQLDRLGDGVEMAQSTSAGVDPQFVRDMAKLLRGKIGHGDPPIGLQVGGVPTGANSINAVKLPEIGGDRAIVEVKLGGNGVTRGMDHHVAFRKDEGGQWWLLDSRSSEPWRMSTGSDATRQRVASPEAWVNTVAANAPLQSVAVIAPGIRDGGSIVTT